MRTTLRDSAPDLNPMIDTKLWQNPCWLSFRTNFIAHHFNQPLYDWIQRRYRLTPPEHVVLYALGLKQGITADDIAASSSRPKNTLSRAVNSLLRKKLVLRKQDQADRRRLSLYLTRSGRRIFEDTVPRLVAREQAMAAALTPAEQQELNRLLTKIILEQIATGRQPSERRHSMTRTAAYLARTAIAAALLAASSSLVLAQTLTIGVRGGPDSIDPHFTATGTHAEALKHLYDTLVWSGDGLEIEPRLAESWKAVDPTDLGVQAAARREIP